MTSEAAVMPDAQSPALREAMKSTEALRPKKRPPMRNTAKWPVRAVSRTTTTAASAQDEAVARTARFPPSESPITPTLGALPRSHPHAASTAVLVAQVRSIVLDLLQATGMDRGEAQRELRGQL